jgi:adenylate cyclase
MGTARVERRLSAILAADVVGYSRLMGCDEQGTLERLKAHRRELFEPLLAEHRGRIVKLMGDGALCEFGSVVDAVACAVAIQQSMAGREQELPEAERIRLRIGINTGDVIIEGDDIYGDGVNVAARLEGLAEPGGICVSGWVHEEIARKLAVGFVSMGAQRVKNIAIPVEVWRVVPGGGTAHAEPVRRHRALKPVLAAALALVLAVGVSAGAWWWYQAREPDRAGGSPSLAKTSLAVLPFANLSGDERWERFADGITEDLITDLAQDSDLLVIARNSTQAYKGNAVDVRQVGRELGVRYVLEGSLQAGTGRVRLTAQLIDATSGGHLWAERYDRPEEGLFAIQDEVAQKVAAALGGWYGRLNEARRGEAKRRPPASLDAYDLYLLGTEQKHKFTRESMAEAIRLLARAVELDPGFARAWVTLGVAYSMAVLSGFVDDPVAANASYVEFVKKAAALDPNDSFTQTQIGCVRALEGDQKGAEAAFDQALALAPNDAVTLTVVAWNLPLVVGRADEAVRYGQRAMMLDPAAPAVHAPGLAIAQYIAGEYEEAVTTMRRAPLEGGEMLMYWAMAQAQIGHAEEAHKAAERIRTEFPSFSVEGYIRDFPVTAPPALAAIQEGATKAGLMPVVTQ